jgi:glycosyltransferase involved in cell wall biosynthesis
MEKQDSSKSISIGVVITFYNGSDTISTTINSVLEVQNSTTSTYINVVIVNDGSSTVHTNYIEEFNSRLGKTILINKENGGVASARNTGFKKARELGCEFVVFLDQDDLLTTDGLKYLIAELSQEPGMVATYGSVIAIDGEGNRISDQRHRFHRYAITRKGLVFSIENTGPLNTDYLLLDCCIVSPGQALIKTDALSELDGPFNESLHGVDDWDLWLRLSLKGKITGIKETTLNYRIHDSNVSKNIAKMRKEGLKMRLSWLRILPLRSALKMAVFYIIRAYSRRSGK